MRVGIEASPAFRSSKTGVGWYTYNLVQALATEMPDDQLYLCYIRFVTKAPVQLKPNSSNIHYRRVSLVPGKLYAFLDHYLVGLPIDILARAKTDVFVFPNYFRWPLWMCRKSVVVIHDLAFAEAPQYLVPRHREYMGRRVPQSVRKASHVLAVSNHTKQQLIARYGVPEEKITVVEPALDRELYAPANIGEIRKVKRKYGIDRNYLLFLGTTDPRKNVDGLVKAYSMLPDALKTKYQLVLAGAPGRDWGWAWYDEQLTKLSKDLPSESLVRTGYVEDKDKPALMSGANLFVWPSHYEGWGMPILEAMACGTPVLTARNSSLPEAGGDAAAYVDANTPEGICDSLVKVLNAPEELDLMRERGYSHIEKFTWEASAQKLSSVLRKLADE